MRIVFCWSMVSGYMAACWRELARRRGVSLHVIAHRAGGAAGFRDDVLEGIDHTYLQESAQDDCRAVARMVADEEPDVVAITGWWLKAYRRLMSNPRFARVKFVMGVDSPWRHELQFLTRVRYWPSFGHVDHFMVAGERSWQYVRRLGARPDRISRGMYGVDVETWTDAWRRRQSGPWPRRFLFAGRYAREKAIDILIESYRRYRDEVDDPWPLTCCGQGDLAGLLRGAPGVEDAGFVQPGAMGGQLARAGVFVIPSRFDPWPLALVEAAAAGLPIICTDACGSAVENVRPFHNGFVVPVDSVRALCDAMVAMHERERELPEWGRRSHEFASAYSVERWADRWCAVFDRLIDQDVRR